MIDELTLAAVRAEDEENEEWDVPDDATADYDEVAEADEKAHADALRLDESSLGATMSGDNGIFLDGT
jgi:hypothetical protein